MTGEGPQLALPRRDQDQRRTACQQ
jgi:hypothetical protein